MRRYFLYLAVALLTFGIGVFVAFKFYWSNGETPKLEETVKTETNIQTFAEDGNSDLLADEEKTHLPCERANPDDSQPWVYKAKVLDSFPPDDPLPRYLGAFRDKDWNYQLILYQDAKGVFGVLLNPVLDADSPSSVIRDNNFDSRSGKLKFSAKAHGGELQFDGILRGRKVTAAITQHSFTEKIILKRIKWHDDEDGAIPYKSRAEFDCAAVLSGRAE